ncbi:Gfo/Idh/MocA family oxidoreductase [Saccharopolyspora erythraea]|uniref:Gfo/Idh/MocA family protein n=1 Tax=Saccharopolyspora erythraea TaxID=1836 RepID=UPI001BABB2DE|nr:Gfo/Idh/MocA family oxidoreductase [Saccharopolyspora erythraea]QUH03303.1 Gfo/Idh/MocA family oxidoreductase [Saccharopolyspora erythraea]
MTARRIAVVGLGVISRFYLAAIESSRTWELAAVCDVREAALEPHRDTVTCYEDHRTMMAQARLDAVVVTVPNDAHGAICRDALLAGLAVCVEKPLTLSAAEGRELDALARMREVALFTAFHRRYNRNVRALLARQRATGAPIRSMAVRYLELIEEHIGQDTWYLDAERCGGGCVADNGPNAFDLVRLFLGDVEVVGSEITRDGTGTDRQARVALRSGTGVEAVVELDWSHPGETKDVELVLDNGSTLHADMLAGHPEFKSSLWHEYAGILDDFSDTLAAPRTGDGGLAALELVEAAYRAERPSTALPNLEGS